MTEERNYPPMHPGRVLELEFLEPLGITAYRLAKGIGVPPPRAYDLVRGKRGISADTALRLARYFGTSPEFWMNLQAHYDLEVEEERARDSIEKEVRPLGRIQRAATTAGKDRMVVAYHEAGHAVVGHLFGLEITRATIVPTEEYQGFCFHEGSLAPKSEQELYEWYEAEWAGGEPVKERLERHAMFCFAGPAAEYVLTGEYPDGDWWGTDFSNILDGEICELEEVDGELVIDATPFGDRAEEILRRHWSTVKTVAEALLKNEDLNREQIAALLKPLGRGS